MVILDIHTARSLAIITASWYYYIATYHKIAIIELYTRVRNRSALENACNPSRGADTCSPVIIIVFIHAAHSLNTLLHKNSRELPENECSEFLKFSTLYVRNHPLSARTYIMHVQGTSHRGEGGEYPFRIAR